MSLDNYHPLSPTDTLSQWVDKKVSFTGQETGPDEVWQHMMKWEPDLRSIYFDPAPSYSFGQLVLYYYPHQNLKFPVREKQKIRVYGTLILLQGKHKRPGKEVDFGEYALDLEHIELLD